MLRESGNMRVIHKGWLFMVDIDALLPHYGAEVRVSVALRALRECIRGDAPKLLAMGVL